MYQCITVLLWIFWTEWKKYLHNLELGIMCWQKCGIFWGKLYTFIYHHNIIPCGTFKFYFPWNEVKSNETPGIGTVKINKNCKTNKIDWNKSTYRIERTSKNKKSINFNKQFWNKKGRINIKLHEGEFLLFI